MHHDDSRRASISAPRELELLSSGVLHAKCVYPHTRTALHGRTIDRLRGLPIHTIKIDTGEAYKSVQVPRLRHR